MFKCDPFTIRLEADPKLLIAEVSALARENDIELKGDERGGTFDTGVVGGKYEIVGNEMTVTVTDRPYKANCHHLEGLLRDLFTCNRDRDYVKIFGFLNLKRL